MKKVSTSLFHTSIYLHGWGSGLYFCGQFVIDIHFQVSINPRLHTGWILPLYFGTSFHITLIFCIRSDKVLTFFRSWKLRSSLKHIPSLWLCLHNIMLLKWTPRAWLSFLCSGIRCHLKCPGVPWGTPGHSHAWTAMTDGLQKTHPFLEETSGIPQGISRGTKCDLWIPESSLCQLNLCPFCHSFNWLL